MTTGLFNLLDFIKMHHEGRPYGHIVNEVVTMIPEVSGMRYNPVSGTFERTRNVGAGEVLTGDSFKTLVRKTLPNVDFRNLNEGSSRGKGSYETRTFQTYLINPRWDCDAAMEDRPEFPTLMARSALDNTEATLKTMGKQFYYGNDNANGSAKGGPGLIDFVHSDFVVDAAGATAKTSVWFVKFGMGHVSWQFGNGLRELMPKDRRYGDLEDGDGNPYTGVIEEARLYPGVRCESMYSCGRIKNLGTAAGKKLTIDRMDAMWDVMTAKGVVPDAIFMTVRSQRQLTDDHKTTEVKHPPTVQSWNGVPILLTNSIQQDEA